MPPPCPDAQTDPGKGARGGPPQPAGVATPTAGAARKGVATPSLAGPGIPAGVATPALGGVRGWGVETPQPRPLAAPRPLPGPLPCEYDMLLRTRRTRGKGQEGGENRNLQTAAMASVGAMKGACMLCKMTCQK